MEKTATKERPHDRRAGVLAVCRNSGKWLQYRERANRKGYPLMKRPILNRVSLKDTLEGIGKHKTAIITMSVGQWDGLLKSSYDRNMILLELNDDEMPVAAYRRCAL
jgi:hypothetical protein